MFPPLRSRAAWALAAAFALAAALSVSAQTTITASTTYTGDTTLAGALSITPGGASAIALTSNTSEVTYTLTLGGDINVNGPSGTDVTIGGSGLSALSLSLGGADRSFAIASGNTFTVSNDLAGTGNLAKTGAGALIIAGSTSYIGDTAVNGGTLVIADDTSLGSSGNLSFDGGTLRANGTWNTTRTITLNSGGGTVDNGGNSASMNGVISGSGALTLAGSGSTTLSQANTYTGGTTISAGTVIATNDMSEAATSATGSGAITIASGATLQIGDGSSWSAGGVSGNIANDGTVNFNRPASYAVNQVISGTGNVQVSGGASALITLGANNTYSGSTEVIDGTLADSVANAFSPNSVLRIDCPGYVHLYYNETVAGLADYDTDMAGGITLESGTTFTVSGTTDGSFSGAISGPGALTKGGSSTLTLTNTSNTYTGGTTLLGGILNIGGDGSLGDSSGGLTFNGGTLQAGNGFSSARAIALGAGGGTLDINCNSLALSGVISGSGHLTLSDSGGMALGRVTLSGTNTYTGGTTVQNGVTAYVSADANLGATASGLTLDDGVLQLTAADTYTHDVLLQSGGGTVNTDGLAVTLSGKITGSGGLTVKSRNSDGVSPGVLTLTNPNNQYAGQTTLDSGTLEVGVLNALPTDNTVDTSSPSTLQLSFSQTLAGLTGGGAVTIASGGTLTLNVPSATTTQFDGTFSGAGGFTKNGSGTFVVSQDSTSLSGSIAVNAGTLQFGTVGGTTGSIYGNVSIASGATLIVNHSDSTTLAYPYAISGAGTFEKDGSAELGFTNASNALSSFTGNVVVNAGTLTALADIYAPTASVSVANGATLNVSSYASTGATIGALWGAGSVTVASGKTLTTNVPASTTATFSGTLSGAGGFTASGAGTQILTANSTALTGPVSVTAGTLRFGDGSGNTGDITGTINVAAGAMLVDNRMDLSMPLTVDYTLTGSGVFSKTGTAVLQVTSSTANLFSAFTGAVALNAGTLAAETDFNALSSSFAVNSGATFDLTSSLTTGVSVGSLTGSGSVTIASGKKLTVSPSTVSPFQGVISGSGGFEMAGTGTESLSGSNTYSGDTWVTSGSLTDSATAAFSANSVVRVKSGAQLLVNHVESVAGLDDYTIGSSGTVSIFSAGILQVNNAAAETFTGTFSGSGSFIKSGAGSLTFANPNLSTFSGILFISQGTLSVGALNALTAGTVAVSTGATFDVANSTAIGSLSSTGTVTVASGQTLTLKNPSGLASVIGGAGGVTFANGNSPTAATFIATDETYTGLTTVSSGTLQIGASGNGSTTGSVAGDISLSPSTTLLFDRGAANATYSGSISGSGVVQKSGSGTLVLTGTNTYTGSTTVNAGTLQLGNAGSPTNVLPTSTTLGLTGGTTLDVAASQTIKKFANSLNSIVKIETGQIFKVALGGSGVGTSFDGVIQGTGGFEVGASTNNLLVTVTGENTYTGGTTIDAGGMLRIGNGGTTGGIQGDIVDNGSLIYHRSDNITYSGLVSGSGSVSLGLSAAGGGVGELTVASANTYSGGTNLYAGDLQITNSTGSATGTGALTIYSGGALLGTGRVSGDVTVQAGGTVALATDPTFGVYHPANLTLGATTLFGSSRMVFLLADANGTAGVDNSLLSINGALALNATASAPIEVSVYSVNSAGFGLTANFNPAQAYSWTMATASGGITGFAANNFFVDTPNFQNSFPGSFDIAQSGNTLLLQYSPTAVPEPATWALLALGCGVVLVAGRRSFRRR